MLFGVKARLRCAGLSALPSGRKSAGKSGVAPLSRTCSMRPATCALVHSRELQLVEDVAGDARIVVRCEQAAERPGRIAGRGEFLLPGLYPERGGERREAQVERHQLQFGAAFVLLVGEGLAHAVARRVERIGAAELVVAVIRVAVPEAHRVDAVLRPIFALRADLRLARVDARAVRCAVEAGDRIERVVLRDRGADEALIENGTSRRATRRWCAPRRGSAGSPFGMR